MTEPLRPPDWIGDFALPAADTGGAIIALDLRDSGLWAGRIAAGPTLAAEVAESRITERTLDVRAAEYLRGRYPAAAERPGFIELLSLVRRARPGLADRDSVLLMGAEHIRLLTISVNDFRTATVPEINRAHGMIVELAGTEPVHAVLLGPGTARWPGLWEALDDRGFDPLLPGEDFPDTFPGDDQPTGVIDALPTAEPVLAWQDATYPDCPESQESAVADVAEPPENTSRGVKQLVLTAIVLFAIGGGAVWLAMVAKETPTPTAGHQGVSIATTTSRNAVSEQQVPTVVDRAELSAARVNMLRYERPTPTTTTTTVEAPPRKSMRSPARSGVNPRPHRPSKRTIPNPIPGLPPIVLP